MCMLMTMFVIADTEQKFIIVSSWFVDDRLSNHESLVISQTLNLCSNL